MNTRRAVSALAFTLVAVLALPAWATELRVGIGVCFEGQAPAAAAATTQPAPAASAQDGAKQAIAAAFDEALRTLGDQKPQFIFITENLTSADEGSKLIPFIFEKAKSVPVYGGCLGSSNYTPVSASKGFLKKRGISVMAVAGDFDWQAEMVKVGPVEYFDDKDKETNPAKYERGLKSFVDNRQKPGEELGKRMKWGPDQNLLFVTGQLHNPEITYFGYGLRDSKMPANVAVIGAACQGGRIYFKDKTETSAELVLRISGKFKIGQAWRGPFWDGKNLDKYYREALKEAVVDAVPKPDLVFNVLCASWQDGPMEEQHKALQETLGKDLPFFFGTYGGGEMFTTKDGIKAGGAFCGILAVKAEK